LRRARAGERFDVAAFPHKHIWLSLGAAAVGALVVVGVALAANSTFFSDAPGDSGGAPDLGTMTVSSDDSGTVTVTINVANRTELSPSDEVGLGVDVDQNPETGSVYHYGQEYAFAFEGSSLEFFRANSSGDFDKAPSPASLKGSFAAGVGTISFSAADLGIVPTSGFNFSAIADNPADYDAAPDFRTFNYQLVAGAPAAVPPPDTTPPVDQAVRSRGKHGTIAHLNYAASDGRGETADTIRVYRGRKVLKTIRFSLDNTIPFLLYYAKWKVPKTVRGKLRFCVTSTDRAGNKSNTSCAALIIK
jgi:hypothetical protein